jgi:hypothetical protein
MPLSDAPSGRNPPRILDHLVLIGVAALPLAAFLRPAGPGSRAPGQAGAVGLAAVMLMAGYFLWSLPGLGVRTRGTWIGPLVLPAFMALVVVYLVLAFVAFFCDPDATVMVVIAQLAALIYVTLRA